MERDRGWSGGRELIDFASGPQSGGLEFNARLSVGAVTLTHCTSQPIEGRHLGAAQITAAIHDGATFDMDWRGGESDRLRSSTVSHGRVHIGDGRLPLWVRCNASPSFFAFAVEESFITEIWRKAFDGIGDCFIGTSVGIEDPVIGRLELNEGGAGGRLYVEGLASALAVHLLRSSRLSRRSPIPQVWACAEADSALSTTSRRI
jgi:AraC family transcriptional regulator